MIKKAYKTRICVKKKAKEPSTKGLPVSYTHLDVYKRQDYMGRDICNLKRALTLLEESDSEADYREKMKRELFPKGCSGNCYYRE